MLLGVSIHISMMKSIFRTVLNMSLVAGTFVVINKPLNVMAQVQTADSTVVRTTIPDTPSKVVYDYAMAKCFLDMPDDVMPLLSTVNRADFIDFWASHMTAKVTNKLQGTSVMDMLSEDYLHIKTGAASEVAIKLIPLKRDTVICMSYTVHAPLADSHIELYNLQWERLADKDFIQEPQLNDFFVQCPDTASLAEKQSFKMAIAPLNVFLRSIILSPNNTNLVYLLTSVKELTEEQQKTMKPYLKDSIVVSLK